MSSSLSEISFFKLSLYKQQYLKSSRVHDFVPLEKMPNINSTSRESLPSFLEILMITSRSQPGLKDCFY